MNLTIPVSAITAARKLLTRIRFERLKLPVLNHVLATIDAAGLTLAVTDLDHWLEIRISASIHPHECGTFLIPAEALAAAARGDKGSSAQFDCTADPKKPVLKLTVPCGGMPVETVHHPEPAGDFPSRPSIEGRITAIPKETMQAIRTVAVCVSTDATRHVLNGVFFSPDNGGIVVATDGRRLAGAPARVPGREFVLPTAAVHVLVHPDFLARDAAILQPDDAEDLRVQFRSGPLTLIAKTTEGHYPGYRHVIPRELPESVTIPETRKPALISWLRSLKGRSNSVRLTWEKPGHLTLTHRDYDTVGATIQVPVDLEGQPPVISFNPEFLAGALEIGSTLRMVDGLNPGMTTDPSGNFCLVMSRRDTAEHTPAVAVENPTAAAIAA